MLIADAAAAAWRLGQETERKRRGGPPAWRARLCGVRRGRGGCSYVVRCARWCLVEVLPCVAGRWLVRCRRLVLHGWRRAPSKGCRACRGCCRVTANAAPRHFRLLPCCDALALRDHGGCWCGT